MDNYRIRTATKEDTKAVNQLLTKLIHDEKQYDQNINDFYIVESFYEHVVLDDRHCIFIAEVDGKIVGYLYGFVVNNQEVYNKSVTQLDALYVECNERKRQIASLLIEEFKAWSRQQNASRIELKVCNENKAAISLYEKKGFTSVKTIMALEIE